MSVRSLLRVSAGVASVVCAAALAVTPAAALAHRSPAQTRQAAAKKAVAKQNAASGLGTTVGQRAASQLAAVRTAIDAAPAFFPGHTTGCVATTPMLTNQSGQIIGGNFRDPGANCYVWINLAQTAMLTGSEICKVALHEMGHLNGLSHSTQVDGVMFSPFSGESIPAPCQAATIASFRSRTTCPAGTTNADYCQAAAVTVPARG